MTHAGGRSQPLSEGYRWRRVPVKPRVVLSSGAVDGELRERIARATEELRAIEEELTRKGEGAAASLETLEELKEFRAVIDHLRTFLWAYVEAATKESGGSLKSTLQSARVERTRQMLHALREQLEAPGSAPVPAVRSLFEEITAIADTAYDRHLAEPPPGSSADRK